MEIKSLCVVCDGYPYKGDSFFAFVANLCEEFARQRIDVTIITYQSIVRALFRGISKKPYKEIYEVNNGLPITVYRPYVITLGNRFEALNQFFRRIAIRKVFYKLPNRPSVCYSHFWTPASYLAGLALKKHIPLFVATGEASVTNETSILRKRLDRIKKEKLIFSSSIKGVICVSTKNLKESVGLGLASKEKCIVLPNAINGERFKIKDKKSIRRTLGISSSDFVVAYTGAFIDRKGSNRLSQAINLLYEKGITIKSIFIGKPQDFLSEVPDCPGIIHCGPLANDEVPNYLNAADLFVLPTLAEGCCNSIVEALGCGLPVISSDCDFNYDVLNDSNSILVDPQNPQEIADAIKLLYKNRELLHKLSTGATESARNLTIDKRASAIIDFINRTISD